MPSLVFRRLALASALTLSAIGANAAAIAVAYNGNYDERVSAPGGDYDAIGGLDDVGEFTLLAGNNYFLGAARSPDDSSDFFLVRVASGFRLLGAFIEWGTNANAFNPIFNSGNATIWTLEESDSDPTIFLRLLGGDDSGSALTITAPAFQRGAGSYGMTLGNGVFAMANSDAVAYRMNFLVESLTVTPPTGTIPEPSTWALVALALAGAHLSRHKNRS